MNEKIGKEFLTHRISDATEMVTFSLGGMLFEYDKAKNQKNIEKHGISFKNAARVFF